MSDVPLNGNGGGTVPNKLPQILQAAQAIGWVVVVFGGGVYGQASLDRTEELARKLADLERAVHAYHREEEIERAVERRLAEIMAERRPRVPPAKESP